MSTIVHCRNCGLEVVKVEGALVHADGYPSCPPAFASSAEVEEPCS